MQQGTDATWNTPGVIEPENYNICARITIVDSIHGVTVTSFCLYQIPPPCWRYTLRFSSVTP